MGFVFSAHTARVHYKVSAPYDPKPECRFVGMTPSIEHHLASQRTCSRSSRSN